ncbi:hypothetical protein [Aeoliella sp.]|uniref:hypothetical protein n=1 Tax=Aeoliella sp. TaxID=2795800 RepID=UPI003CCB9911
MGRGVLFALLYGFLTWVAGGIVAMLLLPIIADDPRAAGKVASQLVFLFLAIPAAIGGFFLHRFKK